MVEPFREANREKLEALQKTGWIMDQNSSYQKSKPPPLVLSVIEQNRINGARSYPMLIKLIERIENDSRMDLFWKKTAELNFDQKKLAILFSFVVETLHIWLRTDPARSGPVHRRELIATKFGVFEREFAGQMPDEASRIEYYKKAEKLTQKLYDHLVSKPFCLLDLEDPEDAPMLTSQRLLKIKERALYLSQKNRTVDLLSPKQSRTRKSKIKNAGARFFAKEVSAKMRDLFDSKPCHELVATLVSVVFDIEVDAGYIQKI